MLLDGFSLQRCHSSGISFSLFLTALLTITRIMNKINNREEMKYMCKVIRSDEVKRAGANGTRGPMRGTAHYIKKNEDTNNN